MEVMKGGQKGMRKGGKKGGKKEGREGHSRFPLKEKHHGTISERADIYLLRSDSVKQKIYM